MLDPQPGPYASRAFTTLPHAADTTSPSHLFRLLLLRRLRIPLPLSEQTCRCRRNLDLLGDRRAACSTAAGPRRFFRTCSSRVCREADARVTMHTRVSDLNLRPSHKLRTDELKSLPTACCSLWPSTRTARRCPLIVLAASHEVLGADGARRPHTSPDNWHKPEPPSHPGSRRRSIHLPPSHTQPSVLVLVSLPCDDPAEVEHLPGHLPLGELLAGGGRRYTNGHAHPGAAGTELAFFRGLFFFSHFSFWCLLSTREKGAGKK